MDSLCTKVGITSIGMFTGRLLHGNSKTISIDIVQLSKRLFLAAQFLTWAISAAHDQISVVNVLHISDDNTLYDS